MNGRYSPKIMILHPGKTPKTPNDIGCFSDVWAFYLSAALEKYAGISVRQIPSVDGKDLELWFDSLDVTGFDAVLTLGLRYFSRVSKDIPEKLRQRLYPGFLCQIHDGSRLDNDPIDLTFTFRNDEEKYPLGSDANRYVRHHSWNVYAGWAADSSLNCPAQDPNVFRILVDHTNYGDNPIDRTVDILKQIKGFVESDQWSSRYKAISVRRFDSKKIVDVDFNNIDKIEKYDRSALPFTEVCREHSQAHVFCVTHPESVGLVVLETAMSGALIVTPQGFIPRDRLKTVRHVEWTEQIPWQRVLDEIDIAASRQMALPNSWDAVAQRIKSEIIIRKNIRGQA